MNSTKQDYRDWDDATLVIAAQEGNDQAFAELFARHRATVHKLALSILRNQDDAEDDVQTAFWKAYANIERFQRDSLFSTWLSRIVINQCLMRLRSARRNRTFSIHDVSIGEEKGTFELRDIRLTPEETLGRAQVQERVRTEIRRIPPLLRQVIELKDLEQRSTDEVAKRLGISVAAVKSRLLRARRELRSRMEAHTGRLGLATIVAEA